MELFINATAIPEPWMWLYVLLLCPAMFLMSFALAVDFESRRGKIPRCLALPSTVGVLLCFTRPGLFVQMFLYVLLWQVAPVGVNLVAWGWTIMAIILSTFSIDQSWRQYDHA